MVDMDSMEIKRDGRTVGRVHFGADVTGAAQYLDGKCFLIYDAAAQRYALELAEAGEFLGVHALKDVSEAGKTMETVQDICRWLLDEGADRDAMIVAVGGGILTDIAGFAAAVYKRGVRCAYIPTTLLAQVDAAIGGKTGVNLDSYKNIIGVFKQPDFTYICPEVLGTLPGPVFRAGLAELLKTFIIDNGDLTGNGTRAVGGRTGRLLAVVGRINSAGGFAMADAGTRAEFGGLVAEAAAVKAGIVSRDEFEGGERRKLNLGHTFAHAMEHNSDGHISHGEAVAIGTAMAARLSVRLGMADPQVETDIVNALKICGLPTECPFPPADLAEAMRRDKKAEGGIVHAVLVRSIGDVAVRDMTVAAMVDNLTERPSND